MSSGLINIESLASKIIEPHSTTFSPSPIPINEKPVIAKIISAQDRQI